MRSNRQTILFKCSVSYYEEASVNTARCFIIMPLASVVSRLQIWWPAIHFVLRKGSRVLGDFLSVSRTLVPACLCPRGESLCMLLALPSSSLQLVTRPERLAGAGVLILLALSRSTCAGVGLSQCSFLFSLCSQILPCVGGR